MQIEDGQYSNNSNYVRDLMLKDQQHTEKLQALQKAITKGFESGQASKLDMAAIKHKAKLEAGL